MNSGLRNNTWWSNEWIGKEYLVKHDIAS